MAFRKLQIHSAILRYISTPSAFSQGSTGVSNDCREYRSRLDEWFVQLKQLLATLQDDEEKEMLLSWGQFHYHSGIYLVSLLWPTPGGRPRHVCDAVSEAALRLTRHQHLFSRPCAEPVAERLPMIFPMSWTSSHFILQLSLTCIGEKNLGAEEEDRRAALRQCAPLILLLETDPHNLVTGQSFIIEDLCDG